MLSKLCVENVAVIEKTEIDLEKGFNVFTGETGAGKSILVDAIFAVLGARTSKGIVRTGTDKAKITAVFTDINSQARDKLREYSLYDGDECILYREISADGRTVARVNGAIVPVGTLHSVGESLMSIYGQNDSHDLLNPKRHLYLVDAYGENEDIKAELHDTVMKFRDVNEVLKKIKAENQLIREKRELYEYQIKEIESADIKVGEEDELLRRRAELQHSDKIIKALRSAYSVMYGEGQTPVSVLAEIDKELTAVSPLSDSVAELSGRFSDMYFELTDILKEAENLSRSYGDSETGLQDAEDRLYKIKGILKKYGPTESDALALLASLKEKLDNADSETGKVGKLSEEAMALYRRADEIADRLTSSRKSAAERFISEITSVLCDLNMKNVRMEMRFEERKLSSAGKENGEFLISVNKGSEMGPLAKIASGGENSRIMLAIKSVMSEKDPIDTMIFDEIDTGVSGSGASKIADKIKDIAKNRQVICITHQAQIAAQAAAHFHIEKWTDESKTYTTVERITGERRASEIAKIMGGDRFSEDLLSSARAMINE